jgi:hypothetical protein
MPEMRVHFRPSISHSSRSDFGPTRNLPEFNAECSIPILLIGGKAA